MNNSAVLRIVRPGHFTLAVDGGRLAYCGVVHSILMVEGSCMCFYERKVHRFADT